MCPVKKSNWNVLGKKVKLERCPVKKVKQWNVSGKKVKLMCESPVKRLNWNVSGNVSGLGASVV